jgi:hypothetical protein
VKFDCALGKVQLTGYFFIGKIPVDALQHLPFPLGKFFVHTNRIEEL